MLFLMKLVPDSADCQEAGAETLGSFPAHSHAAFRELARLPTAPEVLQTWTQPQL